jgi:hypothetical protein
MDPDLINAINRLVASVDRNTSSRSTATGSAGFSPTAAAASGKEALTPNGQSFIPAEISRAAGAAATTASAGFSTLAASMSQIPIIGETISGMMGGLGDIFAGLEGHLGAFGSVLGTTFDLLGQSFSSLFNVGKGLVNLVFGPLDALFSAAQAGGGSNEYRQAIEDIRKSFGDLRSGVGGQVYGAVKNINGMLAETGLTVRRVFGSRGQMAQEFLKASNELGATISQLGSQLEGQAEHFLTYRKVFDLSEDGMRNLGLRAITTGTTLEEQGRQIAQVSLGLANRFGSSARQIGRDIGEMIADVKNFGGISPQILGNISAHMRQLGLTVKNVIGVVEGFDNFETAAKNSATLAQQFGIQVDALQMMKEQDPAARFETLRKQFFATGQSVETMSRQQIAALVSATGMDESAVRLGFSLKNQSKSYADVQKQSESAQKKQLSQAEAMQELSHSIDRMVQSGQQMQGGFFQIFFEGFTKGIMRSREFRLIMMEIRQVMRIVFTEGIRIGRDFVKYFPGVQEIFGGLADIFQPARWRAMMNSVREVLQSFFKNVNINPEAAGQNFIQGIQNIFSKFFSASGGGFTKILKGAGNFIKALIFGMLGILKASIVEVQKVFAEMFVPGEQNKPGIIQQIITTATDVWNTLKEALLGAFGEGSKGGALVTGIFESLGVLFSDIGGTFGSLFDSVGLGDSLSGAFTSLLKSIFGEDSEIAASAGGGIVATFTTLGRQMLEGMSKGMDEFIKGNPGSPLSGFLVGTGLAAKATAAGAEVGNSFTQGLSKASGYLEKGLNALLGQEAVPTTTVRGMPNAPAARVAANTPPAVAASTVEEPTSSSLLEQVQELPTARQLRAISRMLPSRAQIRELSTRIISINEVIGESLEGPLTDLRNISEELKDAVGGTGEELRTLLQNIAGIFASVKEIFTSINTTSINPKILETNLNATRQGFGVIFRKWTGPEGIQVKVNELKTYFENQQTIGKLESITSIFNQVSTTFNEMGTAVSSVQATGSLLKNFSGLTERVTAGGNAFMRMITRIQMGFQTYDVTGLQAAAGSISKINDEVGRIHTSFESMTTKLIEIQEYTSELDPATILAPSTKALNAMLKNVTEIDRQLSNFAKNPITIPATLKSISETVLGKTTEYRITNGNINFNIQVNVTLDSEELSTSLKKAGHLTKR